MEKAYKLLAAQEKISNGAAKELIDAGLVFVGNKKVAIARGEVKDDTYFVVMKFDKPKKLFEDTNLVAVDKPPNMESDALLKLYPDTALLHRLDFETSGVIVLTKNEEFRLRAIEEFKAKRVYKEYIAIVHGIVSEEFVIDEPILTIKKRTAFSKISKDGKEAKSTVTPLEVIGKKSKVKVVIDTGRTHQIRVHLAHKGLAISGDELYGKDTNARRMMLHSHKLSIFDYTFEAREPKEFRIE